MVQDRARPILTMVNQLESHIERRHCQLPWTTPNPDFKVTPLFNAECLRNGTRYNEILIGTYALLKNVISSWVILSGLANYSMTRSIARYLCNSWASCCISFTVSIVVYRMETNLSQACERIWAFPYFPVNSCPCK